MKNKHNFTYGYAINKRHILKSLGYSTNHRTNAALHAVLTRLLLNCNVTISQNYINTTFIYILKDKINSNICTFNANMFVEYHLIKESQLAPVLTAKEFVSYYKICKKWPKDYNCVEYNTNYHIIT